VTEFTNHRYQLTTTVDRTSLALVVRRSGEMVHFAFLQQLQLQLQLHSFTL